MMDPAEGSWKGIGMHRRFSSLPLSSSPKTATINALTPAKDARDKGATAVEYALMAALITAVIVAVVLVLGNQVFGLFSSVPPF